MHHMYTYCTVVISKRVESCRIRTVFLLQLERLHEARAIVLVAQQMEHRQDVRVGAIVRVGRRAA